MQLNEKHYNIVIVGTVTSVIGYLVYGGTVDIKSVIGMFGGIGFNVALLLCLGFGLQKFQLGFDRDIQKEIFDDKNVAVALYQLGIWIALAIVIAKGIM